MSDEFPAGALVVVTRALLPDPHGLEVNGQACDGSFEMKTAFETDVLLTLGDDGCRVAAVAIHPSDVFPHSDPPAMVYGWAPLGATVRVTPTDPASGLEVRETEVDAQGTFRLFEIPPGDYQIEVVVDGIVVHEELVRLGEGQEAYFEFAPAH